MRPIQGHAAGKMASTVTLLRRWRSENYSALFTQDIGRRDPRLLRPMRRLLSVNDRVRKEAKRRSAADRKSVRRRHFSHELKHVLGEIQSNGAHLVHGPLLG